MNTKSNTTSKAIMKCPACHLDIHAELEISTTLGDPQIGDGYSVAVESTSHVERFNIQHRCHGAASLAEPDSTLADPA